MDVMNFLGPQVEFSSHGQTHIAYIQYQHFIKCYYLSKCINYQCTKYKYFNFVGVKLKDEQNKPYVNDMLLKIFKHLHQAIDNRKKKTL